MDPSAQTDGGMLVTFRRLLHSIGDTAVNRVELFALELREERLRLLEALILLLAGGVCVLMALVAGTFAVVAYFWDSHRYLAISLVILIYACAAGGFFWLLRSKLRTWKPFAETVEQFKQDRSCFNARK